MSPVESEITESAVLDCFARSPRIRRLVREITEEVTRCIVRKMFRQSVVEKVIAAVCAAYGVTEKQLLGQGKVRSLITPRHVAAWILRQKGMSYPSIGAALRRGHQPAIMAVRAVEGSALMLNDAKAILERADAP